MATLQIINHFSITTKGRTITGKHGNADDDSSEPMELTVDGKVHDISGELATGASVALWALADDKPTAFDYAFVWVDQIAYVQYIATAMHFILKLYPGIPNVVPGYGTMFAAANSTAITTTEPTMSAITSIVLGNWTGTTLNYTGTVID